MLKQVQHDTLLDSLNDLDLPTSILKHLTPALALTTDNLQLLSEGRLLMILILNPRLSGGDRLSWGVYSLNNV